MLRRYPRLRYLLPAAGSFLLLAAAIAFAIPSVRQGFAWRFDELRATIKYRLNPPSEAVFLPEQQDLLEQMVRATMEALAPSPTPEATIAPTSTALPSPTPTPTPTPLPRSVFLDGVKYEHQHNRWNYCSPANLSMALTFWGWKGNRDVVGRYVKPNWRDKNVLPSEMIDFVESQVPGMKAVVRVGGDVDLLKSLVSSGFPVIVEKGYYTTDSRGVYGWLGHFQFVTGFDEAEGIFVVQDTYIDDGENHRTSFEDFYNSWRPFNYLFMVVYPQERGVEVFEILGSWGDDQWAAQHALARAQQETETQQGIDRYFAWFNVGTSHVDLRQYADAASAYDYAFYLYSVLPPDTLRPYRMLWYQTGPYKAYYYSGRYQDVINLANTTLYETISEPVLEESIYWRGLAQEAQGNLAAAISDWWETLQLHPNWTPAIIQLQRVGEL